MKVATATGRPGRTLTVAWVVLVGLFMVTATYIVVAVPANDTPPTPPAPTATAHADGLSESHDGYLLEPVALPTERGVQPVTFRILGPSGSPVMAYATVQDRPLHLYVAREDLSVFQHVHPRLVDGTWRAEVDVPDGGVYRVYVEFTPAELAASQHSTVLGTRFIIAGDTSYVPVPMSAPTAPAGPYTVKRLDGTNRQASGTAAVLQLQVLDAQGVPVTALEPYLGAYAHVSAFDTYTQAMTHVHAIGRPGAPAPADGVLSFHTVWRDPGAQRVFVEFQLAGTVHQAVFTVVVT